MTVTRHVSHFCSAATFGKAAAAFALGAAISACHVGPEYRAPDLHFLNAYKSATTAPSTAPGDIATAEWWTLFNDAILDDLELAALHSSPDLQAAIARVTQARQAARSVESGFYPTVTADPSFTRARSSGAPRRSNTNGSSSRSTTGNTYSIPFDLSYEIDVWGRVASTVESARATARASAADYFVVLQTLQADVAQDYFTLRSLDAQIEILTRNVELYRRQIELLQTKERAGLLAPTDMAQAQALLESTLSNLLDVRRQRDDEEHALALLTGRTPAELTLEERHVLPPAPAVPAGLPADLLHRRPDVAEAEANLRGANADVAERVAEFYPKFSLTGSAGFESFDLAHAVDWESRVFSIGPSVFIPIFEGGRLTANLAQARARYEELVADYRRTVLTAVRDVEDNLTDLHRRSEQSAAQTRAVDASREYLRLSEIQYRQGIITYLQIIDADRTLLSNELTATQVDQQRLIATVLLFKALGGGWNPNVPGSRPTVATAPS